MAGTIARRVVTVTTSVTHTLILGASSTTTSSSGLPVTYTSLTTASPSTAAAANFDDEMTSDGSEYRLQGCFDAQDGVDLVLGQDYEAMATHTDSDGTGMTLTACLTLCNEKQQTYPYIGVMDGEYDTSFASSLCHKLI